MDDIKIGSILSGRTYEPIVTVIWGDMKGQLTVREAREHALKILECAEAAEGDAFVFRWITRNLNPEDKDNLMPEIMNQFRDFRESREWIKLGEK